MSIDWPSKVGSSSRQNSKFPKMVLKRGVILGDAHGVGVGVPQC